MSTIEAYIKNRLDDQINWYERKAAINKFRYRLTEIIIIIAGALIPFINSTVIFSGTTSTPPATNPINYLLFVSSVLGITISIMTGLSKMEKYFETWILYCTNAELLKKEKFLYLNSAGNYASINQSERDKLLVDTIEFILSSEITKFFSAQERAREQQQQTVRHDDRVKSTEALQLVGTYPDKGQQGIRVNTKMISASFNKPLDSSTVNTNAFDIRKKGALSSLGGTVKLNPDDEKMVLFELSLPLEPSSEYALTISKGVKDKEGNELGSDVLRSFTTGA